MHHSPSYRLPRTRKLDTAEQEVRLKPDTTETSRPWSSGSRRPSRAWFASSSRSCVLPPHGRESCRRRSWR